MMARYDPAAVELFCQQQWARENRFAAPAASARRDTFVYACTPFTTGRAHMGHVRSYTIADAYARRARSQGDAVLWAMGFDAFGLPNEVAAIEQAVPPREWVRVCGERMTDQFVRLGLSVDWTRSFNTSDPDYYRWTQWVFLRFLERGLIYRGEGLEYWCEHCATVLAALQVTAEERCWRCGNSVTLAAVPQYYLRFAPYLDELERGLEQLGGWDETALAVQRGLLAKTIGVEVEIAWPPGRTLTVFTPFPAAIGEATFVAVSPNDPLVQQIAARSVVAAELSAQRRRSLSREQRRQVQAIATDLVVRVPGLARDLPIVVTPSVDQRFGGGLAFGVPRCDDVDRTIAAQLCLPSLPPQTSAAVTTRPAQRYKLRDVSISRQRTWGAPVPVVHCSRCGQVPVPETELPVRLPDDHVPTGRGLGLAAHPTFAACSCPHCRGDARRETDTLDVHFDSIWMLVPFCVPTASRPAEMFTHADLRRWLPVQQVVCGADQAGWWLNDRLCFKVLSDGGYFPSLRAREPVRNLLMHEMVLAEGRKMSKSLGNAVDPDRIMRRYGADTLRLTVLRVNPRKAFDWSEAALDEHHTFLSEVWAFVAGLEAAPTGTVPTNRTDEGGVRRFVRRREAALRRIARAYERQAYHLVLKELRLFFESIVEFAAHGRHPGAGGACADTHASIRVFLDLLEPLAPHLSFALSEQLTSGAAPARSEASLSQMTS